MILSAWFWKFTILLDLIRLGFGGWLFLFPLYNVGKKFLVLFIFSILFCDSTEVLIPIIVHHSTLLPNFWSCIFLSDKVLVLTCIFLKIAIIAL